MDSIFTQIINGQIPAHRIYEDKKYIAFLDIHPITPGHTLVVPKDQIDKFTEMSARDFKDLMNLSHKLSVHIQETLKTTRVVLRIEGFDIPHLHVHLLPVNVQSDTYKKGRSKIEPDHESLKAMAIRLKLED